METEHLTCQCLSPEHTLQFIYDKEDGSVHAHVYLHQYRSFFKKLWVAVKYVCGYKSKYGHWDAFMLRNEDLHKIIRMAEESKSNEI
jgi:hypothetical protein